MSTQALQEVLQHPRIWRGVSTPSLQDERSGHSQLDRHLPGRGWPRGALIELISKQPGIGELQLLLPTLRNQFQCWISPPHIPYAPALDQSGIDLEKLLLIQTDDPHHSLWAMSQVLRSGLYPQVLGWHQQHDMSMLRRLQLAAEHGNSRLFLFRTLQSLRRPSPAALRLFLEPAEQGLYVRILKCRGGQPASFILPLPDHDSVAVSAPAQTAAGCPASRAA